MQKATLAAAACWAVAPTTRLRRTLASLGAVSALLNVLRTSLASSPPATALPVTPPLGTDKPPSILTPRPLTPRGARDALQVRCNLVGATPFGHLVDRCRVMSEGLYVFIFTSTSPSQIFECEHTDPLVMWGQHATRGWGCPPGTHVAGGCSFTWPCGPRKSHVGTSCQMPPKLLKQAQHPQLTRSSPLL